MRNINLGYTILALAIAGLIAGTAAVAHECKPTSAAIHAPSDELTEITISGNLQVETVTCSSFFVHVDFQGYGDVTGVGCSITGPYTAHDGANGNTNVNFSFPDGSKLKMVGCRAMSATGRPSTFSYAIDCTY